MVIIMQISRMHTQSVSATDLQQLYLLLVAFLHTRNLSLNPTVIPVITVTCGVSVVTVGLVHAVVAHGFVVAVHRVGAAYAAGVTLRNGRDEGQETRGEGWG